MSRDSDQSPWTRLRNLEPPLDSQARVLRKAEEELFASTSRGHLRWAGFALTTTCAAVGLIWWSGLGRTPNTVEISKSSSTQPNENAPGTDVPSDVPSVEPSDVPSDEEVFTKEFHDPGKGQTIALATGTNKKFDLPAATMTVTGPANIKVQGRSVMLSDGRVVIVGSAEIRTPRCRANIDGDAEVSVRGDSAHVTIRSGNADVTPGCHVKYIALTRLEPTKPEGDTAANTKENKENKAPKPRPRRSEDITDKPEAPPTPGPTKDVSADSSHKPGNEPTSSLRQQVNRFRRARALSTTDEAAGIAAFDDFIAQWPESPLIPEVKAERKRLMERLDDRKDKPSQ